MARKTFNVADFKQQANDFLRNSHDKEGEQRLAYISMVEGVLHDSGNYRGFGYLNAEQMKTSMFGTSVGIHTAGINGSVSELSYEERFGGTDSTRRVYL